MLTAITKKIASQQRITVEEALFLYAEAQTSTLEELATVVRKRLHGDKVFYNRNIHIEPTNLCIYDCKFCSYSRELKDRSAESWIMSEAQILSKLAQYDDQPITEVHIVGGVHPKLDLDFFCSVLRRIKQHRPAIHIKAFTAVEILYMCKKAKCSYEEGLRLLKEAGLGSLPGGGAEIFAHDIREQICADKCTGEEWLAIHECAHGLGIPSNATMLYGHIEQYSHRVDHMMRLRDLQDRTHGFNTFIPLKFRNDNNQMSHLPELSHEQDMRNFAVARLFLDNIPHLKAYWPMLGRNNAQRALAFGADDLDGTIDDTTKIYSMAGSEEQSPVMSSEELRGLIQKAGLVPVERDTLYRQIPS